jgi:hypothetical protein
VPVTDALFDSQPIGTAAFRVAQSLLGIVTQLPFDLTPPHSASQATYRGDTAHYASAR